MAADNVHETVRLPQVFGVKYLGKREARGLWGIKYTRGPVDDMVNTAKALKPGTALPFLQFKVGIEGVTVSEMQANTNKDFESGFYPVDIISYGVQVKEQNQRSTFSVIIHWKFIQLKDLVYTRVFSMIVVRDPNITSASLVSGRANPFECYAYVCDSRLNARRLTIALATAFQEFSKTVKSQKMKQKRIAIDLRTPEEMAAELEDQETEA
jgi:hypothetical protein